MILPNFLIVGSQKCGTTSLHEILQSHPEANMSDVKEINFFTSDEKKRKGLTYYSEFFRKPNNHQRVTGESTPGYICYPGVAKHIKESLGEIKIVLILRDPIKRAFSQYWDNRRHLSETMTEHQILKNYLTDEYLPGTRGYFSRGVYIKYIEEYLKYFSRENIYIMFLEELIHDPESELTKLFRFLGISASKQYLALNRVSNSSMVWRNPFYQWFLANPNNSRFIPMHGRRFLFWGAKEKFSYPAPEIETIQILKDFYKPWNENLSKFLNKDLSFWDY